MQGILVTTGEQAETTVDSLKRDIKSILITAGSILLALAGLIGFILLRSIKYKSLIKLLTRKIDKIPNQGIYDDLVKEIQKDSKVENLNTTLDDILQEGKLIDQEDWANKDFQVLNLISKKLKTAENKANGHERLIETIKADALKVGLLEHLTSVFNRVDLEVGNQ